MTPAARSSGAGGKRGKRVRMSAEQRREHLLEVGSVEFARAGYRGTTTASIARAAGITEPVLYQHYGNKLGLYRACVEEQWRRMRTRWEAAIADEPDPARWTVAIAASVFSDAAHAASPDDRRVVVELWPQAITESAGDEQVRELLRHNLAEIHAFVADIYRRAQAAGAMRADLDPAAEAWILLSIGILRSADTALGGLVAPHFGAIVASRTRSVAAAG